MLFYPLVSLYEEVFHGYGFVGTPGCYVQLKAQLSLSSCMFNAFEYPFLCMWQIKMNTGWRLEIIISLTFHIWSTLPCSFAFNSSSASFVQVLKSCFCDIPLYSTVVVIKYSKLILKRSNRGIRTDLPQQIEKKLFFLYQFRQKEIVQPVSIDRIIFH